jgi:hypothetical protein
MLMTTERRPAVRTLRGWAISTLLDAGAILECEEHGWMQDRSDPRARERAVEAARHDPPPGVSPDAAVVAFCDHRCVPPDEPIRPSMSGDLEVFQEGGLDPFAPARLPPGGSSYAA